MEQEESRIVYDGENYFRIMNGRRYWIGEPPIGYELTDGTIFRGREEA